MDIPESEQLASGTAFTGEQLRTFKKRLKTAPGLHNILRSLRIGAIFQMKIYYCFTRLGEGAGVVMGLKSPQDRDCLSHSGFGALWPPEPCTEPWHCTQGHSHPSLALLWTGVVRSHQCTPNMSWCSPEDQLGRGFWGSGLAVAWLH